jgi:CHRD domain-containing protein
MKRAILTLLVALAVAVPAGALGAPKRLFHVNLRGSSEVPKNSSHATGTATFRIIRGGKAIRFRLTARGLHGQPVAAHIHLGGRRAAGPVMITLEANRFRVPASGTVTKRNFTAVGSVKTFAQAIRAIRAGRTYANIHTTKFAGGEVRGQLR